MKKILYSKLLAIALVTFFSPMSLAADNASATKTIAATLINLNHFPSDAEKAELNALADDDGVGRAFRAVASAVANIQHAATAEDKEIMNRIIASNRAHANAKLFAAILLELNHVADEAVKARLQDLL
ncbi:MAG: hypothetical protein OXU66_06295 [Gammaproteobacteria bacterium]|nr:hypothetical protein [Gammaproteobacteria bacterium]MDD9895151.1 hypothetical protein [Gammaproteobacteria bacterium]MDD9958536.1 hypothetical protein [Gammaproteobacteria bacterium]